jgi:hypothetical protein
MPKTAKKTSQPAKKPQNKTAFILSLPMDMPASDAVQTAKTQGIELTDKYVYNIRATARSAARKKTSVGEATVAGTPKRTLVVAKTKTSAEDLLKAIAAEIGLGRAMTILSEQRAQVTAVLGG